MSVIVSFSVNSFSVAHTQQFQEKCLSLVATVRQPRLSHGLTTVSYTHLTLPTILLV